MDIQINTACHPGGTGCPTPIKSTATPPGICCSADQTTSQSPDMKQTETPGCSERPRGLSTLTPPKATCYYPDSRNPLPFLPDIICLTDSDFPPMFTPAWNSTIIWSHRDLNITVNHKPSMCRRWGD